MAVAVLACSAAHAGAAECEDKGGALGVSRIIEIDAASGPLYGDMSMLAKEESFLGPKEVVLTFDDGPMPKITGPILDALDKFCTKATFFSVGRMAIAYPAMTKEIMARGHTLGTHTWSHPFYLRRSSIQKARDEIERGFAAVALAAGQPIAPFFRFPGLSDSNPMMAHLQSRGVAAFTVDVVSNDSYIGSPSRLTERTIRLTEARNGGILLFHDIKSSTARALPEILRQLKAKGFKIVHLRAKNTYTPVTDYDEQLTKMMEKSGKPAVARADGKPKLIPFTAGVVPEMVTSSTEATPDEDTNAIPVTELAPEAKDRGRASTPQPVTRRQPTASSDTPPVRKSRRADRKRPPVRQQTRGIISGPPSFFD